MASGDASQLAYAPERRLAYDGRPYTRSEFMAWYGDPEERQWEDAGRGQPGSSTANSLAAGTTTRDAAQLPVGTGATTRDAAQLPVGTATGTTTADFAQIPLGPAAATTTGDAAQLPVGTANALAAAARLMPGDVIAIQQEEAARGPPRSLQKLARDTLDAIANMPVLSTVNLDDCFPWMQYVAAHRQNFDIIGPGITHAHAEFLQGTNDRNRGGALRLDFCFYRTDGTVCRVHPGRRAKEDAELVFGHFQ